MLYHGCIEKTPDIIFEYSIFIFYSPIRDPRYISNSQAKMGPFLEDAR